MKERFLNKSAFMEFDSRRNALNLYLSQLKPGLKIKASSSYLGGFFRGQSIVGCDSSVGTSTFCTTHCLGVIYSIQEYAMP